MNLCFHFFICPLRGRYLPLLSQHLLPLVQALCPPRLLAQFSYAFGKVILPCTWRSDIRMPCHKMKAQVIHVFATAVTYSWIASCSMYACLFYKLGICLPPMMFEQVLSGIGKYGKMLWGIQNSIF